MIVLLLLSLTTTVLSGMAIYAIEEQAGPMAGLFAGSGKWMEEVFEEGHEFFANFTLFLVLIHLAGVVVESLVHQENLVTAMINGKKRVSER